MNVWQRFEFHRLVQIPRPEQKENEQQNQEQRREISGQLTASLIGAHADLLSRGESDAGLMSGWIRLPKDKKVHILFGGRPLFPPAAGPPTRARNRQVLFPPGALAENVSATELDILLAEFTSWVPCAGRADALWAPSGSHQDNTVGRRGSFTRQVAQFPGPFAWLVLAEPLRPWDLKPELDLLVNQILPLTRGEVGEGKRIAQERKQARHRELSRAQVGSAWRIRVVVGGRDAGEAKTAAAMLCSAAGLDGLQYVLSPIGSPTSLVSAMTTKVNDEHGNCAPINAGTELLVALTQPPDHELPGIRLVEPHTFDVSTEPAENEDGLPLFLGEVLDVTRTKVDDLFLPADSLNRHTFVCGATGSGKSQTIRHLLTEATRTGLPWLAIEPAKAEYSLMAARLANTGAEVFVIRPGDHKVAPAGFNPLEPAPKFSLQTHLDLLKALFLAAFEAQEPFPQILAAALTRCYEELGWDLTLGTPIHSGQSPRYPTLGDLQRVAAQIVTEIGYGKEISDNIHGFIKVRLGSLRLGTLGRFFEGGHRLDFDLLRNRNVVLEIEDVGDDADKAFFMGAVLMRLSEHLRVAAKEGLIGIGLKHLTVIEEAHRLLRRAEPGITGPAVHAVEMFASLLAEVRAYGEGLIIAEQIPSKLTPDVIKNTAVKIVHRLPAQDDRDSVGATMNVDKAQSRYLVTLVKGEGAVFTDGMDRPVLARIPDGTEKEKNPLQALSEIDRLIKPRSKTCGYECKTQLCTLKQMREAQHLLSRQPWLVVWSELTVLAHLTGHPAPLADVEQLTTLKSTSDRELDCALSHAIDNAVAARSAELQYDTSSEALALHCLDVVSSQIAGVGTAQGCAYDEPEYLAQSHRWQQVLDALNADLNLNGPHPDTASWEQRFFRSIPGSTTKQQFTIVEQWDTLAKNEQSIKDTVAFGSLHPSALESAIAGLVTDTNWEAKTRLALEPFSHVQWALHYLLPPIPQPAASNEGGV